jgi:parvulin-like peptidyl-prolyl isomerase
MRSNNPYDMVPKFFVAAFSIKPGEITQTLVKTSYRWHVIRSRRQTPAQPAKL